MAWLVQSVRLTHGYPLMGAEPYLHHLWASLCPWDISTCSEWDRSEDPSVNMCVDFRIAFFSWIDSFVSAQTFCSRKNIRKPTLCHERTCIDIDWFWIRSNPQHGIIRGNSSCLPVFARSTAVVNSTTQAFCCTWYQTHYFIVLSIVPVFPSIRPAYCVDSRRLCFMYSNKHRLRNDDIEDQMDTPQNRLNRPRAGSFWSEHRQQQLLQIVQFSLLFPGVHFEIFLSVVVPRYMNSVYVLDCKVLLHTIPKYFVPKSLGVVRAVLIEQLFSRFSSFFPNRKKQETFPKFRNLTEGKTFGMRIPIFGKTSWKIWKYKTLGEKNLEIWAIGISIRTALIKVLKG